MQKLKGSSFKYLGFTVLLLIALAILLLAPVDKDPIEQDPQIAATFDHVAALEPVVSYGDSILRAGWARVNIVPEDPIHMAGYGRRGPYTAVSDSLYANIVVFDNGSLRACLISLDLLMFPRAVKSRLIREMKEKGFKREQLYLTATHTHNGFGNWDQSKAGSFIFGGYNEEIVTTTTEKILKGIDDALENLSPVTIGFQKVDAREFVINRIDPANGIVDPYLRVMHLKKESGELGMIVSFSGHAVNLDADIWTLSRDYPGILTDALEQSSSVDFAMFCAGMVASHNIDSKLPKGPERISRVGNELASRILDAKDSVQKSANSTISYLNAIVDLPPSQMRLSQDIRLRNWVFAAAFGLLEADISMLQIGDVVLVGMPCDYSGELSIQFGLDQYAQSLGKELFITSFNGNYVGYITADEHYFACNHDEVLVLNWVGPYKGAYFTELIQQLVAKLP